MRVITVCAADAILLRTILLFLRSLWHPHLSPACSFTHYDVGGFFIGVTDMNPITVYQARSLTVDDFAKQAGRADEPAIS